MPDESILKGDRPPPEVVRLIDKFALHHDDYRSGRYNETQLRREFIDPLFKALGWDVDNEQGDAEAYKEVIHEDSIKVEGAAKAPDYSFRIGGTRKFMVEAKRPASEIKTSVSPAFQLRRYAWSAKLPLSVLTNFEEFVVYDCRVRPFKTDKAATARVIYLKWTEYEDRWHEIAAIFSKDAVRKGSFDKYADSSKRKRGTAEVDDVFLTEIESWRESLARTIATRNPRISREELNYAVQAIIDRIIFLRMCEGRGIEPYGRLQSLLNGGSVYRRLCELFDQADGKYNSGLFHFQPERGREPPDDVTPGLAIDDQPLKEIFSRLYYPESPYEFSVIPADILGQVYEQFLGKVIRLTTGHRAKIDEKPEVKKSGGVYYTPTYIVEYIVRDTLSRLVESRSAAQVSKMRIVDPACGSGSFLISAYQYLLDWHRDQYVNNDPTRHKQALHLSPTGDWRLTTLERRRILLNNIFGVDVDPQAVEVTKLSLLLKVLEGETDETLRRQQRLFHALPDLASNIKCGNSLIGPDYFNGAQLRLPELEEQQQINPFDWKASFPEVFRGAGGFHAVIGNPPYLFLTEVAPALRRYFECAYRCVAYRFDLYGAFIERSVRLLLRADGRLGFIVPHTLLSNDSFQALRAMLAADTSVYRLVDLGPGVFRNAKNETMLLFFNRSAPTKSSRVEVIRTAPNGLLASQPSFSASQTAWLTSRGEPWLVHVAPRDRKTVDKMSEGRPVLGEFCTINQGLRTGDNLKYLSAAKRGQHWKPAAGGRQVGRYAPIRSSEFVLYDPSLLDAPRRPEIFTSAEKIVVQEVRNISLPRRIVATLDREQVFCLQSTNVINARAGCRFDLRYLLGVINSTAVNFFFRASFSGNNHIPSNQLARIPIPEASTAAEQQIASTVDDLLVLHDRIASVRAPHERNLLLRQVEAADRKIDLCVFELYDLTESEIRLTEDALRE